MYVPARLAVNAWTLYERMNLSYERMEIRKHTTHAPPSWCYVTNQTLLNFTIRITQKDISCLIIIRSASTPYAIYFNTRVNIKLLIYTVTVLWILFLAVAHKPQMWHYIYVHVILDISYLDRGVVRFSFRNSRYPKHFPHVWPKTCKTFVQQKMLVCVKIFRRGHSSVVNEIHSIVVASEMLGMHVS